jgi:hypothetical protein
MMVTRMTKSLGGIVLVSALFQLFAAWGAPAPAPIQTNLRTYRFTARIKKNAGITPLPVGKVITGTLTYDLKGKNTRPAGAAFADFQSARNSLVFEVGGLRFSSAGDVLFTVGAFDHAEHYQVVAFDLQLPKGWEMDHTRRSQTYGIVLQNAPAKGAVPRAAMPDRLSLSDFTSTRELRLDFFHGVRFPGGAVRGRATVYAVVETLEEVRRPARRGIRD